MKIGKIVKNARLSRGLKQQDLADALGVTTNYISLLENDHRDPSWRFVCDLAEEVKIPLPLLLLSARADLEGTEGGGAMMSSIVAELKNLADAVQLIED